MGQYLKTELTSDQLEVSLADGIATVQSVMLNTEYINEMLSSSGIFFSCFRIIEFINFLGLGIFSLVDSYVRELSVSVPWKKLPSDSTIIRSLFSFNLFLKISLKFFTVSGLQLTLEPLPDVNIPYTQDLGFSYKLF